MDFAINGKSGFFVAPWICNYSSKFNFQFYFFGNSFYGQVAPHFITPFKVDFLIAITYKSDFLELINVEKVWTF